MDHLIPSLEQLLLPFRCCFRSEVFEMFQLMVGAWIVCLGRRRISRVWETTGRAADSDHSAAYRLFNSAVWDWDELATILISLILVHLVPGATLSVITDDTLAHKRGAKVAFGGIFLDAVLSSKRHKVFRFGNNWVMLGIAVQLPFRKDRISCLPVLWRIYEKKSQAKSAPPRTKGQLAAEMVVYLASRFPTLKIRVVGDSGYVGKHLLQNRPENVSVLGPIRWDAALSKPLTPEMPQNRKRGERHPSPKEIMADDRTWPAETITVTLAHKEYSLEVKVIRNICWYHAAGPAALQLVLVRDLAGNWRNEALICTDPGLTAAEVIGGYCQRWSVEVAFWDCKQLLGFHDAQVWSAPAVERVAPLAGFVGSLVVLWYHLSGRDGVPAQRQCPWYRKRPTPTFSEMLATCRLQLWQAWLNRSSNAEAGPTFHSGLEADLRAKLDWLLTYIATAA